jgi:microcystin-dependent protein
MGLFEEINSGKHNLILFGILFLFIFHQYWNKSTETMADVSPDIKDAIKQVYLVDVESIRNLSNIATQLTSGGLTIPGDLRITGNILMGNKDKNQWIIHTPPDDRGLFAIDRVQRDGNVNWTNGFQLYTSADGTQNNGFMSNFIPKGMVVAWTGSNSPPGWALCDGQSGTPDLRGRFILGSGNGANLTARAVGQAGGEENVTLNVDQMPAHSHPYVDSYWSEHWGNDKSFGNNLIGSKGTDNDNALYTKDRNTSQVGGNKAHNNMPPFYVLAYIMKL